MPDTVLIEVGLHHNQNQTNTAKTEITKALDEVVSSMGKSVGTSFDPMKRVLETLNKAITDLTKAFATVDVNPVVKGMEQANKGAQGFAQTFDSMSKDVARNAASMADKVGKSLGFVEGSKELKELQGLLEKTFAAKIPDTTMRSITKMNDVIIESNGQFMRLWDVVSNTHKGIETLFKADPGDFVLHSAKRLEDDFSKALSGAQKSYKELTEYVRDNNLGDISKVKELGEAIQTSTTFSVSDSPVAKLAEMRDITTQIANTKADLSEQLQFDKVRREAESLAQAFEKFLPAGDTQLKSDVALLYVENFKAAEGSAAGFTNHLKEMNRQFKELEEAAKAQEQLAAGTQKLEGVYEALLSKVKEFNQVHNAQVRVDTTGTEAALRGIVDVDTLQAARTQVDALEKSLTAMMKAAVSEESWAAEMDKLRAGAEKAADEVEKLTQEVAKLEKAFNEDTLKAFGATEGSPSAEGINSRFASIRKDLGGVAELAQHSLPQAQAALKAVRKDISDVTDSTKEFQRTAQNIKTDGSPFQNLFAGIPATNVNLAVAKERIEAILAAMNKASGKTRGLGGLEEKELTEINKQLKDMKIHLKDGVFQNLPASGGTSGLPTTFSGVFTRLTEFYSARTAIFAVANQFRDATRAAIEMNQAVHDIIAISGESSDKFGVISDSIYEIAKNSRFTAQEVSELMQVLAQAGVAANVLPGVAAEVGRLATATGSDTKTIADLTTTALNAFHIEATNVERISNTMTAALNLSKLEAQGLAVAFNYLGPQAAQLGMSLEQTMGMIAVMAQSGIRPSTIGTGGSQLLKELAAPKPRLRALLADKKINPADVNPMNNDFADIIQVFQDAKVSVDELFQAMDTRVARAAITAINMSAAAFRQMTEEITNTQATLIAYSETMQGARARMNQLKQMTTEIASQVGEFLAPVFIELTRVIRGLLTALGAFDGRLAKILAGFVGLAGFVVTAASIAAGFDKIAKAVKGVETAAKSANIAMTLLSRFRAGSILFGMGGGAIAGTAVALAAVGGAIWMLGNHLDRHNRELEEARKAQAEYASSVQTTQRLVSGVIHGTEASSKAYSAYVKHLKEGKTQEDALKEVKGQNVTLSQETADEIRKYIADNGPHAKLLEGLLKEEQSLDRLIKLNQTLNNIRNTGEGGFDQAVVQYTQKWEAARAIEAKEIERAKATNEQLVKKGYMSPEAGARVLAKDIEAAGNQRRVSLKDDIAHILAQKRIDILTGDPAAVPHINAGTSQLTLAYPEAAKKITTSDGSPTTPPGFVPRDPKPQFLAQLARTRKETLELQEELSKLSVDDLRDFYFEASENVDGTIAALRDATDPDRMRELMAQLKTVKDLDKAIAAFSADSAVMTARTSGLKGKDLEGAIAAAQLIEKDQEEKAAALRKVKYDKELENRAKLIQKVEASITQLDYNSRKKRYADEKKNAETIMSDAYTDETKRLEAYHNFIAVEKQRVEAEFDKTEGKDFADLLEKQKSGKGLSPDEQKVVDKFTKLKQDTLAAAGATTEETAAEIKRKGQIAHLDAQMRTSDAIIANARTEAQLAEQLVWSQDELLALKNKVFKVELDEITSQIQLANNKKDLATSDAERAGYAEQILQLEIRQKQVAQERAVANQSLLKSFGEGVRATALQLSNTQEITRQLGSTLMSSAFTGVTDTLYNTLQTVVSPDKQKIAGIKKEIADLREQKAELEANIHSTERNTDLTPQETQQLGEYKEQLESVNSSLSEQEKALRKTESAWSTFADGMKNIVKVLIEELQKYIIQMMAAWAVQKMIGFAYGAMGGDEALFSAKQGSAQEAALMAMRTKGAEGGFVYPGSISRYAAGGVVNGLPGGFIPLNLGSPDQDSVPALLMPGEMIIRKSMVDYYGKDFLLKLNEGKIEKLASGGIAGGGTSSGASSSQSQEKIVIYNVADPSSVPQPSPDDIINVVSFNINSKKEIYQSVRQIVRP